jgi:hypothetical protein
MILPVSSSRPVELLRTSSDQIRRAAAILAQISEETNPDLIPRLEAVEQLAEGASALERDTTIRAAQRSFAARQRRTDQLLP